MQRTKLPTWFGKERIKAMNLHSLSEPACCRLSVWFCKVSPGANSRVPGHAWLVLPYGTADDTRPIALSDDGSGMVTLYRLTERYVDECGFITAFELNQMLENMHGEPDEIRTMVEIMTEEYDRKERLSR